MAQLTSLSPELISMVADRLTESEDFFNLRHSSRYIESCSKHHYLQRFFGKRRHMLSRHSLKTLGDIVSDDVFGPTLQTLVIGIDHLTDDPPLEDPLPFELWLDTRVGEKVNVNKSNYDWYLTDQNSILGSGLATAYLTSIFSKATNCNTLIIDDYYRAWGAGFLKRETGVYPTTDIGTYRFDSHEFLEKALGAIFIALTASGIHLQTLEISMGCGRIPISPEMLAFPQLQPLDFPCSSTLTQLELHIEPGHEYVLDRASWLVTLNKFINHFEHVETLSLSFESAVEFKSFHEISRVLYLPHLQNLVLSGIDCTEDDLVRLFQSHSTTLQEISLDAVNLIHEGGSWHSIFIRIRDHLKLQLKRLNLTACCQDERDVNFLEDDAAPSFLVLSL